MKKVDHIGSLFGSYVEKRKSDESTGFKKNFRNECVYGLHNHNTYFDQPIPSIQSDLVPETSDAKRI
jgi:hypothetical protein